MVKTDEFPEEGEHVVCTVRDVQSVGAFVVLDEYGQKEGFIHIAEVASGWVKHIRNYVRPGQKTVCKVLRVDRSKGQVDLSLKQVNEHERREKIQEWKNEQRAERLLLVAAEKAGIPQDAAVRDIGIPLVRRFGTLYAAFEVAVDGPKALEKAGFSGPWVAGFVEAAKESILPPTVSITGTLTVSCLLPDGVQHIRDALLKAEAGSSGTVVIKYIGAPRYRVEVIAPDYRVAEAELKKSVERATVHLKAKRGVCTFARDK